MFRASPLPSVLMRVSDLEFVAVNDACVASFGWQREELIGRSALEVDWFADKRDLDALDERMARDGRVCNLEVRGRHKNGEIRIALISVETIVINDEPHTLTVLNDVTASEAALRASETRFAHAFTKSPLPVTMLRLCDSCFIDVNEAFLKTFGYERDELIGHSVQLFHFWADDAEREATYAKFQADGRLTEHPVRLLTKSGDVRDLLWTMECIDVGGEDGIMCTMQDVTNRKRDEGALRESEARFRQIAENIREVFWLAEPDLSRIVYVSPAYEAIWGRAVKRLYANPNDWLNAIHVDDRERVMASAAAQILSGNYEAQYRIVRPDGQVRWIHDRGFPVRDDAGNMIRFAGFAEDVTQRLQLEDELRQTQKMESLGMLAGGVAHDFNNVLAVIASCNGLLAEDIPTDAPNRELADEIEAAVNRAAALTRQLLAFSRKQVTEPRVVDLNAIVNETCKMLRRMVGEDVMLSTSLDPDLGRARVDPGYLVQVLMNLAVNARDAMPRGGTLTLTTRNAVIDEHHVRRHPCAKRGRATLIEVSDTGTGMPPDVVARIFEPFFTTKAHGKGTGMGLAVVHGIVDQAGGLIEVDSLLGIGTTFRVYLPTVDGEVETSDELIKSTARGCERILLVDDDHHVRRAAARALRARGYDVTEAGDGETALAKLDQATRFDLLLTDVVMPAMDGRQLAAVAQQRFGELKVLYMSGYTDDAVVRHGVMQGMVELIEKPFRIDSLAKKVRQVLDATSELPRNPQPACEVRSLRSKRSSMASSS
jgi:two-component system, cell cycle sensor histidine kinase and response regulator CckA